MTLSDRNMGELGQVGDCQPPLTGVAACNFGPAREFGYSPKDNVVEEDKRRKINEAQPIFVVDIVCQLTSERM